MLGRNPIWIVTIPQFSHFSGDKMFTTDPAVIQNVVYEVLPADRRNPFVSPLFGKFPYFFSSTSSNLRYILAILIPLSRPLRVPQPKIAHKTIFLIINTTRGHMFTGKWCAPIGWPIKMRSRDWKPMHMRSHLKSPVCSKWKVIGNVLMKVPHTLLVIRAIIKTRIYNM